MEEGKKGVGWKYFLAETAIIITGAAGMWFLGRIRQQAEDRLLGNCVMTVFLLAITGFHMRREYMYEELDYDNEKHIYRFLLIFWAGLVVSFICGFLPVGGWPFLLVFVILSLFSNMSTGILAAASLLLIAVMLSGGDMGGFVLYFVSGVFAVTFFRHLSSNFRIGIPLFLSILCLLVCETANVVLVADSRPDFELFVIPVSNMIISFLLLLGCLKLFYSMVIYPHREKYLDLNDTGNQALTGLKERDRKEYMQSIHTAYFCERIGIRLGLNADALKCAAYYYRLGDEKSRLLEHKRFPPVVSQILSDYEGHKQGISKKETAVLLCSDTVVGTVSALLKAGEKQIDYDKVIDGIFRKMLDDGTLEQCEISLRELRAMQKLFKEEKLYYEFLR